MKKPRNNPADLAADILAALMWGPKTAPGVAEVVHRPVATVREYLSAFHAAGVAYVKDTVPTRGTPLDLWALQPRPYHHADAREPYKPRGRHAKRAESAHGEEPRNQDRATPGNAGSGSAPGRAGVAAAVGAVPCVR